MVERFRVVVRWWTALSFAAIGVLHFTHDDMFAAIMPPMFPESAHRPLVWLSGVFEVLGGVGLLVPFSRRVAGWGLLALLVAVFPANIHMAVNEVYLPVDWLEQSRTGLWLRLPFQVLFAWLVWFSMGPRDRRPGANG